MLTIPSFINLVYQHFTLHNKNITFYDDKGIQISEDADLLRIIEKRILFFTRNGDDFDNKNLLRMFRFIEKIGEGGFGKVYLVEQKESGLKYAIKFLRHSFKNVKDVQFLYKEIDVLLRLENPNIVKLYSYFETEDSKIALIMEYASGGTLRQYIKSKGKLSENETKNILKEILSTISYCHKMGIIHHDLKTENILFTNELHSTIKIIDFGICSLLKTKSKAGSLQYLPPEILSGRDTRSLPSVDIWSIGCILFEMLTGTVLFDGNKREDIKKKILSKNILIPSTISIESSSLICEMLRMRPSDRINVNDALNHAFFTNRKLTEVELSHCTKYMDNKEKMKKESPKRSALRKGLFLKILNTNSTIVTSTRHNMTSFSLHPSTLSSPRQLTSTLPNLITKVTKDFTEDKMFQYNLNMMSKYHGDIPNFLKPIGFSKEQKHNFGRMASSMNRRSRNTTKIKKKQLTKKIKIIETTASTHTIIDSEKYKSPSPKKGKKIYLPSLEGSSLSDKTYNKKRSIVLSSTIHKN